MVETLKYVYVMFLFLSIFQLMVVYDSIYFRKPPPCITDKDCPQMKINNVRCRKGFCIQIHKFTP
ncbi:putative Late nodulin [Medicago truncatula]|uniref:Nodule Cysteine-Rich (NCR) secreted peptide n=1 Tax=Medicago truncatula TaxID=3880 RepID=G7JM28_MEDTR|nr:Nodule Cysteine-Rich (NCR) secreted peptide [Medicago truncatula]RHN59503.1 putative Late nodulin [Medicago truncatula]